MRWRLRPTRSLADTPLSCVLGLAVIAAGSEVSNGTQVQTSGEQTAGLLDCDVRGLSGSFATTHDSIVVLHRDLTFSGKLNGTFTMVTGRGVLTGKIKATISGQFTESGPVLTDVGTWKITDGSIEGKGDFVIELSLVPIPGGGFTLAGLGSLTGTLGLDD